MSLLPSFKPEAARGVLDRAQATLVWLAVLALVLPEPAVRRLIVAAMAAVALAAVVVALLAPTGRHSRSESEETDDVLRP